MTKYAAEHSSAFQDIKDAGARVSFTKKTMTVSGAALQIKGDPGTCQRQWDTLRD